MSTILQNLILTSAGHAGHDISMMREKETASVGGETGGGKNLL